MRHVYRLIAFKDSKKRILAEYRGDTEGYYNFQIERVEIKTEKRECCSDGCGTENMSYGSNACTCDAISEHGS